MYGRAKMDDLSKNGRSFEPKSRTIVDCLLSQSLWSWAKVDGHSLKSGRSLGINLSIKVDGPKMSN